MPNKPFATNAPQQLHCTICCKSVEQTKATPLVKVHPRPWTWYCFFLNFSSQIICDSPLNWKWGCWLCFSSSCSGERQGRQEGCRRGRLRWQRWRGWGRWWGQSSSGSSAAPSPPPPPSPSPPRPLLCYSSEQFYSCLFRTSANPLSLKFFWNFWHRLKLGLHPQRSDIWGIFWRSYFQSWPFQRISHPQTLEDSLPFNWINKKHF